MLFGQTRVNSAPALDPSQGYDALGGQNVPEPSWGETARILKRLLGFTPETSPTEDAMNVMSYAPDALGLFGIGASMKHSPRAINELLTYLPKRYPNIPHTGAEEVVDQVRKQVPTLENLYSSLHEYRNAGMADAEDAVRKVLEYTGNRKGLVDFQGGADAVARKTEMLKKHEEFVSKDELEKIIQDYQSEMAAKQELPEYARNVDWEHPTFGPERSPEVQKALDRMNFQEALNEQLLILKKQKEMEAWKNAPEEYLLELQRRAAGRPNMSGGTGASQKPTILPKEGHGVSR